MVGLHTCGDLAPSTLRIFASKSEARGLCSIGCCYHLLSEEFETPREGTKFSIPHTLLFEHKGCFLSLPVFFVAEIIAVLN